MIIIFLGFNVFFFSFRMNLLKGENLDELVSFEVICMCLSRFLQSGDIFGDDLSGFAKYDLRGNGHDIRVTLC